MSSYYSFDEWGDMQYDALGKDVEKDEKTQPPMQQNAQIQACALWITEKKPKNGKTNF